LTSPTDRALIEAVDGVALTVRDIERAVGFYSVAGATLGAPRRRPP
jgi:hypothetical protein